MKKLFFLMLSLIIAVLPLFSYDITSLSALAPEYNGAKGMVILDASTHRVLSEKNKDERLAEASTTKIMTALVAIENCKNPDIEVEIPESAVGIEGTSMYLRKGEKLSVRDLLYGLILPSGNDAAVALAIITSGSEEKFTELMNKRAEQLGLKNTHFSNSHGLDAKDHYTSAYDLAVITAEALKNPLFAEISQTKNIQVKGNEEQKIRFLKNKNKLLSTFDGCIGVKTGFTDNAGRCFVSAAERQGLRLICVVLNAPNMFEDSEKLLNSAFEKYHMKEIIRPYTIVTSIPVAYAKENKVNLYVPEGFSYPLTDEEYNKIEIKYDLPENLSAPLKKEQPVGKIEIYLENRLLFSENIYTMEEVKSVKFFDKLENVLEKWNI